MTNSKSTGNLICPVAALVVAVLACAGTSAGAGAEWDVYPGESIQAAIDGASEGDTIYVHAGVYVENVDVGKRLTLAGEDADVVTVTAASSSDHVFEVTADYVNISGFTATGATSHAYAGIYLSSADHCNISENDCSNNDDGIRLYSSSDNTLANNTANSNNDGGIWLDSSSDDNMLTSNTASDNYYGISLSYSSNNTLASNTANSNNDCGIRLDSSINNIVYNNCFNNTANAYDTGNNQWDSGIVGNYWSDYREKYPDAEELYESEIWDTPYVVRLITSLTSKSSTHRLPPKCILGP